MPEDEHIKELKEALRELGAEEADLDEVIQDVNDIVVQRAIKDYLSTLQDPVLSKLTLTLSGPELMEYVKNNPSKFPPFSEEKFKKIAEETWKDYFEFMSKE